MWATLSLLRRHPHPTLPSLLLYRTSPIPFNGSVMRLAGVQQFHEQCIHQVQELEEQVARLKTHLGEPDDRSQSRHIDEVSK